MLVCTQENAATLENHGYHEIKLQNFDKKNCALCLTEYTWNFDNTTNNS